jgi:dihydropteroate synthase
MMPAPTRRSGAIRGDLVENVRVTGPSLTVSSSSSVEVVAGLRGAADLREHDAQAVRASAKSAAAQTLWAP